MTESLMEQDRKRRAALAMQAELLRTITPKGAWASGDVTTGAEPLPSAAGKGRKGKKIAKNPAAARAPEAGDRWPTGPQSNRGATGSSAPQAAARGAEAPVGPAPKTKPNRRENEFMLNLMVLRNTLKVNAPACRERARAAGKWIWRDIRLLLTLVCRIQEAMLRTMPESRDEYYTAYAMSGHYELHIDGPIRTARHLLITDRHLAAMAEAAMKSECILCMREGSEIGKCPLREALLETAVPTEIQEGRWEKCEYRDAAGKLVQGKDVTV